MVVRGSAPYISMQIVLHVAPLTGNDSLAPETDHVLFSFLRAQFCCNLLTDQNYCACRKHTRQLHLHFLRSPVQVVDSGDGDVVGLELGVNMLHSSPDNAYQLAVGTGQHESLDAQLVLESIGYKSFPLSGAPFDDQKGIIPNT